MPEITIDPRLYEAARVGNTSTLLEVLRHEQQGIVINITNGVPSEPVRGYCLSGVTCTGDTALHVAARFGRIEMAERICDESLSLLTRVNDRLESPLHYAAEAGNFNLVNLFIQRSHQAGSNNDHDNLLQKRNQNGETALYYAVRHEHIKVIEKLMQEDPQLASIPDKKNVSPLYLATILGSLPIVNCLVQQLPRNVSRGAHSGPGGRTVLHDAALSGKTRKYLFFSERKMISHSTFYPDTQIACTLPFLSKVSFQPVTVSIQNLAFIFLAEHVDKINLW
jgi:Ankyrin repeats (3 copies)